jgi:hypothetical protein
MSRYAIGERWRCDRSVGGNPYNRPPFDFVIIGKGTRPGYKLCRIEGDRSSHPEQEYSHKHLNKYAVHTAAVSKTD